MDTAFEKIGLYDLFGTFLAGTIIAHLLYFITELFLLPEALSAITQSEKLNLSLNAFSITVLSFVLGLILENCASVLEKKCWKFRKNAMENIVMEDKMVQQGIAREEYQNMMSSILGDQAQSLGREKQGEYVYQYCKIYLEANKLNSREININAIYVLSRNVMLGLYGCIIWCLFIELLDVLFAVKGWGAGFCFSLIGTELVLFFLCKVFKNRCVSYAEYRVKVVLREFYYYTRRAQARA